MAQPNAKARWRRWFPRPAVAAIAILWLLYMLPAAFVIAVDPYDLYPWGVRVKLPPKNGRGGASRLIRAAAKDPGIDTVLIGTSPTVRYTPADMKIALPEARRPWNASYVGGASQDRIAVLDEFVRYSRANRFIVSLDYFIWSKSWNESPAFEARLYDRDPLNALRILSPVALRDSWSALRTGQPLSDLATFDQAMASEFRQLSDAYREPRNQDRIRQAIATYRSVIDRPSSRTCHDFPVLTQLIARIRALALRGARVDVLIPVYSPSAYYIFLAGKPRTVTEQGSYLNGQMLMRKCLVMALASIPNASVYAADDDAKLVNDPANFYDMAHLRGDANLIRALHTVDDPRYRLTPENVDAYIQRNVAIVKNYRLP